MRAETIDESVPFYAVKGSNTLREVIGKILATHVHHVYVIDAASQPVKVISLLDILEVFVREADMPFMLTPVA